MSRRGRSWVRGHQTYKLRRGPLVEGEDYRVEDRGHDTPCWVWLRYCDPVKGYGRFAGQWAHRVAYRERHGECPPELDHRCRVRPCVNPDHLEPATSHENAILSPLRTKLSDEQIRELRSTPGMQADIAAAFGISASYVSRIMRREVRKSA